MTTTVIVKANHGWPVDVTAKHPATGAIAWTQRVEPNTEQSFSAHNCADLVVHEVQPVETAEREEPADDPQA